MKKLKTMLSSLILLSSALCIAVLTTNASTVNTPPITRAEAENRALKIINLSWDFSSDKNSKIDPKYIKNVTLPKQFQGVTETETTGIPYNWGGLDGVDTHSFNAPWTDFLDAVNKGAFTGNVSTNSKSGYIAGTAGMDCSGFVQSVFNITGTRLTSGTVIGTYFQQIDLNDIKHMDVLDKPGTHVAIFDRWGTLNGVYGAYTYESTPDQTYGGIQGTKQYFMSLDYITKKSYIAARYINLTDDNTSQAESGKFKTDAYAIVANVKVYTKLRSSTDKNYTVYSKVPKDTLLYLLSYSNGFYKVAYNNNIGWIKESSLSEVPAEKYVTVTGTSQLNIRSNANTKSSIVGGLSQNQYAEKLGISPDGYWYQISFQGITGWCYKKYLTYLQ